MQEKFITHSFNLQNNLNELSNAEDIIEKLKKKLLTYQINKNITDKAFVEFYEEIIRILDYVGGLSQPYFDIEKELEEMYVLKYNKFPELSKQLFFEHYEKIHHPYTLLKNRCFKMLDDLDELYITLYKKNPPNWKY